MAKILAMADLHLSDWASLGIDETGRSIFLRKVVTLAELISKKALDFNADVIVIAGDIYNSATITPSVGDAADEIVRTLSKSIPLILTVGQHDEATKTPELFPYHTHLSRFKNYPNVVFGDRFTTVNVKGQKVCIAPWNPERSLPPKAEGDIFVGHGAVQGCVNFEGYRFNSGFNQDELFKRFRLSVVGDIHQGQQFYSTNGRKILIPGPPVQFNFKDSPVTGIWLCDVPDVGEVTCEFVLSESMCPNTFPKYLFTEDLEKKSSRLIHYRYRPPKTVRSGQSKAQIEFRKDTSSIMEIGLSIIKRSKIDNQELASTIFLKLMESLPSSDRKVPRSKLHSVEIHNFLSIEDFQLDFKEFPDNLIVTGKNGSGKSALVEAIYWCLTGANTKGVPVNDVRNYYAEMGTWVTVVIEIEDVMYKFGRGRTDGPQLQIFSFTDKWMPYTGTKTAATQDVVYELLGISELEIKLLSYFPANNPSLFGSIGKSDRYSLLSTIVGMSSVDVARDKLADIIKAANVEIASVQSKIGTLRGVRDNAKTKLGDYLAKRDITADTGELEREKAEIEDLLKPLVPSSELREKLGLCFSRASTITTDKTVIDTKIVRLRDTNERLQEDIRSKKLALVASLEGKCPTCNQPLSNDDVANSLVVEIEDLRSKLPSAALENNLVAALEAKVTEEQNNEAKIAVLTIELKEVQALEARLHQVSASLAKAREGQIDYGPLIQAETENFEQYRLETIQQETRLDTLKHLQDAQDWVHKTLLKRNGLLISELAKQGQKLLQDQVDTLTQGESFSVVINDDLSIAASFLGRKMADYNQLSVGQARVVDIIMMVALNNLFTQIYSMDSGVLGLVIFDEVLSFLDPAYSEFCFGLINRVNVPKRIVISHDASLISRFNNEISVSLEGASSSVYSKNWG